MTARTTEVLTPGRELDALIAEKVMGRVWARSPMSGGLKVLIEPEFKTADWQELRGGERAESGNLPHYSIDIAAAFEVVGKLLPAPDGLVQWPHFSITFAEVDGKQRWQCDFGLDNAIAKTAPEAICLAALKAVAA